MKNVKSLKDLKNELGFYYEVKTIDKVSEGKKRFVFVITKYNSIKP